MPSHLTEMDDRHQSADDPAGGGATGAPHVILLAEDDDAIRILIRRLLERAGYRALVARDGEEALALVDPEQRRASGIEAGRDEPSGR